jgi:hypothetical protein
VKPREEAAQCAERDAEALQEAIRVRGPLKMNQMHPFSLPKQGVGKINLASGLSE